ncbi:MAG: Ig-like domain repeat protein, partial [Methanobrevibacter thaueri]|nr:Ig-like domain repeat protein [Methanobrevibacter thaueri]
DTNVSVVIPEGTTSPEFTINLPSDVTGNFTVVIDGVEYSEAFVDGTATVKVNDLAKGNYTVTVKYDGDDKYSAFEKQLNITVNGLDAGLQANTSDIKVGENATINVVINKDAKGQTIITIGDLIIPVTFTDGKASVVVPNLIAGNYTVQVKFIGDDQFLASEIELNLTVLKDELPKDLNISADIPEGTTSPEFTINLPSDATGNFTVIVDGVKYSQELVNGSATIKVNDLSVGNHTISAAYSGDMKYDGITTPESIFVVPKATIPGGDSVINVTVPENPENPEFSINLPSDATGNLTVIVDGNKTYTEALVNGSASLTVPGLSEGDHNITVEYLGDIKYSSVSKNTTVHVPVYRLSSNGNINIAYTGNGVYKVLVSKDAVAMGIGETVVITFNGVNYNVITDKDGYASFKIPTVAPKSYEITASYKNQTVKNTVKVNNIVITKAVKVKKSKKVNKVKASLSTVDGKVLAGKTLILKFNGKTLKAKTNSKGVASFSIKKKMIKKMKKGKYVYTVTFGQDTASNKLTIKK